mgnify:CR=1 FL=1
MNSIEGFDAELAIIDDFLTYKEPSKNTKLKNKIKKARKAQRAARRIGRK